MDGLNHKHRLESDRSMEEFRERHAELADVLSTRMVFVVGATRWGTAWTQHVLDAHPNVLAKGEGHFTDILFPVLARCFDAYNTEAERTGNRLQLAGLPGNASGFTFEDVDHLMTTAIGLVFARWLKAGGDGIETLVEKTPEHVLNLDLLNRLLPEMKVIHLVRDGRDEAVSAWDFNIGISRGDFPRKFPTFAAFAEHFARNWARAIGQARRFGRAHRARYLQIRCEDMIADPAPVVRRVFRFAGVVDDDGIVREAVAAANRLVPLDIDPGVWRDTLDEDSKRAFARQCGELLKLLDYDD